MLPEFSDVIKGLTNLIEKWEPIFLELDPDTIANKRNSQNRSIKQIVGHMVDSATNNTHRIIHLQYQNSPFEFPNYATNGNNDRWISIQNYQNENWTLFINLWKYTNLHYTHLVSNINMSKLNNEWITGEGTNCSLKDMVIDYLRHFELHLSEVNQLINQ